MPGPGIWKSQPNALAVCFRLQLRPFVTCGGHYSQEMLHLCPEEGLGRCLTGRTLQLLPTKREYYSQGMGRPFPKNPQRQCKGRRVCMTDVEKKVLLGQECPRGGKIKILNYILCMWLRDGSSGDSAKEVGL